MRVLFQLLPRSESDLWETLSGNCDPLYFPNARYKKLRVRRLQDITHKKFPCPNCPSVFVWKCTLKRHLRNECGKEPKFKCPHCEYRGKWKANVIRHIKRVHKDCSIFVYNN
ncbi:uncharacterized protein LOC143212741 [Lasioglossum baleicum]|uniref:uncharacterized protein LOC143212741 n=1 Tax=Lasioglossum baleicum TaxID=434251 RepID=UPI003FCEC2E5